MTMGIVKVAPLTDREQRTLSSDVAACHHITKTGTSHFLGQANGWRALNLPHRLAVLLPTEGTNHVFRRVALTSQSKVAGRANKEPDQAALSLSRMYIAAAPTTSTHL
jgi:hypothetical protein